MKTRNKYYIAALGFLATIACAPSSHADDQIYHPFPQGYSYMHENQQLEKAVETGNIPFLRQHGWKLWAGIMQQPTDMTWPVWYSWPNATAAYKDPAATATPCPLPNLKGTAMEQKTQTGLLAANARNSIMDDVKLPTYPIPAAVIKAYPEATSYDEKTGCTILDGKHFQFNGDIMIPTESFSKQAFDWIHPLDPKAPALYKQSTLDELHAKGVHQLQAPTASIVTKHMYWPVKKGQLGVLPVWMNDYGDEFTGYAGYELWNQTVAIDPSNKREGETVKTSYLYGVDFSDLPASRRPTLPISKESKIFGLDKFYHHQVTQKDWDSFDQADKAILNASSYWAYNQPFEPGDYLVSIAMHINTKEVPSWALNSTWWSPTPNAGKYSKNRPLLPQAKGPWQHYELVDAYDVTPPKGQDMPVAMNPYIELVIHPVATNCQNCHIRAGWPISPIGKPKEKGKASYQNPDCDNMLAHLTPESGCLAPLTLTDYQWTIPDRAF
ncbi:hypothetical protein [Terasakiella sp. SH-1]|uniref:hypothetical protein n=1 Tax=Terasakiella sp. SH-1 TaxID=2560057 RepID=UPI001073DDAF|nr:hypothetical protein [Terasakiella sp. SH-1]